tara:strand:+ start:272 stop:688 length:417 start_codon:yes stop_codon:yes gene_type:complete
MSEKRKIRVFELKKGLYITPKNYERFAKRYDKAVARNEKAFPFRNHEGKVYKIETAFVEFVLKTMQTMDHGELIEKANEYKKLEERLSKEEFEEAQEKMKNEYLEQEKIRESEKKIWSMDGQVMNKKKFKKEDKKENK